AGEDRGHIVALMPLRRSDRPAEVIANLAGVLADAGRTVLVIDADFRSPALHSAFEAARHPGLSDFLSGEMRLEETVVRSRKANLWFMPSGPLHDDPGGLLNGRRMADLVGDMRRRFDFVLVASPSIHTSSDAGVLAHLADSTAVVTAYSGHSVRSLRETSIALDLAGSALAAVILTVPAKHSGDSTPQNLNPSTPQSLPAASTNGSKR
ncbi:MAG TPA: CpsD/CapB family tyrosine-protein kinase, partial [Nocardioides sp.]|nr:CpsD/CapB family tyrosine-protein kinase [Nocardioides sp.]